MCYFIFIAYFSCICYLFFFCIHNVYVKHYLFGKVWYKYSLIMKIKNYNYSKIILWGCWKLPAVSTPCLHLPYVRDFSISAPQKSDHENFQRSIWLCLEKPFFVRNVQTERRRRKTTEPSHVRQTDGECGSSGIKRWSRSGAARSTATDGRVPVSTGSDSDCH